MDGFNDRGKYDPPGGRAVLSRRKLLRAGLIVAGGTAVGASLVQGRTSAPRSPERDLGQYMEKAAAREMSLWQLRDITPEGDLIRFSSIKDVPGELGVSLLASHRATWFKQIRMVREDGTEGRAVETVNENRFSTMRIPEAELRGMRLRFAKAGFLGVHSDLFQIGGLQSFAGQHFTFHWLRDDLPYPHAASGTVYWWRWSLRSSAYVGILHFDGRTQCDGDRFRVFSEPIIGVPESSRRVELVVATTGDVTWRKGLNLYSVFDTLVSSVSVEGPNQRSRPIIANYEELWGRNLAFVKAKFLGRPEEVYEFSLDGTNLDEIGAAPGRRIIFEWQADSLPGPHC